MTSLYMCSFKIKAVRFTTYDISYVTLRYVNAIFNMPSTLEYAFYIGICLLHWNMPSTLEYAFYIGICLLHWNMPSTLEYAFYIGICLLHWNMPSTLEYAFYIGICLLHWNMPSTLEYAFYIGIDSRVLCTYSSITNITYVQSRDYC